MATDLAMNTHLGEAESPRGARALDSLANALTKLLGELVVSQGRVDTDTILTTVTSTIAQHIPVTCLAILMKSDPDMSRIVTADHAHPQIARYIDDYVATMTRPREGPTAGLSQRVIEGGAPLFIPRMGLEQLLSVISPAGRQYVKENPPPITGDFTRVLMVPMHAGPATVGTLAVFDWEASDVLSEADIDWMQRAADRVGLTIDSAQVRNRAADRLAQLTAVNEIALAVASAQDVHLTLKQVVDRVIATLRVDAADILLAEEIDGSLSVAAAAGFRSRIMPELRLGVTPEARKQSMLEIKIGPTSAVDWMGQARRSVLALEGLNYYVAAPLRVANRLVGVLEVFSRASIAPDQEWIAYLETMAAQAAVAVESAEMARALHSTEQSRSTGKGPRPELSDRERQILRLLVDGATNREVGDQLHLSYSTVKFHIRQLLEKAEVSNRTELATTAAMQGWV